MIISFQDLIHQPEPRLLAILHVAKVALVIVAFVSLIIAIVAALFGSSLTWLSVPLILFGCAMFVASVANRWSMNLFARRAESSELNGEEARQFWQTYDWDQVLADD